MPPKVFLTPAEEEYLEALYSTKRSKKVKITSLAGALGIKPPSVVQMVHRLTRLGLAKHDREGVELTPRGRAHALKVVRRHQLAERLLSDVLDYNLSKVHETACKLEHVLDDELMKRLEKLLGTPAVCPHGEPIPNPEGKEPRVLVGALVEIGEGEEAVVARIPEDRGTVERLLSLNLIPGSKVRLLKKLHGGAVLVQIGRTSLALSRSIAKRIHVLVPGNGGRLQSSGR
jgi:DtxR family Mn-dependent transcriptional regulator